MKNQTNSKWIYFKIMTPYKELEDMEIDPDHIWGTPWGNKKKRKNKKKIMSKKELMSYFDHIKPEYGTEPEYGLME